MSNGMVSRMKEKFDQYGLWDFAGHFFKFYEQMSKFDAPEVRFKDGGFPSDDCFKTLVMVKNAIGAQQKRKAEVSRLSEPQIKDLLQIPYAQVEEAAAAICMALEYPADVVCRWFEGNADLFFVTKESVEELQQYLSGVFDRSVYRFFFKEALLIGVEETRIRIETLREVTGSYATEVIYEMYCRNPERAYLFYPYYTDPVTAMKMLREHGFDCETAAHILKTDQRYLYAYKSESRMFSGYELKRIDELVAAYQRQTAAAEDFNGMRKNITPENGGAVWKKEFLPRYEEIKKDFLVYPICPGLLRALIGTVSVLCKYGVDLPDELKNYYIEL